MPIQVVRSRRRWGGSAGFRQGACVLLAVTSAVLPSFGRADPSLRERFLREGPQGWAALEAHGRQIDGSGVYTKVGIGSAAATKPPQGRSFRFQTNGPCILYSFVPQGDKTTYVSCVNSIYGFNARKDAGASGYSLRYAGTGVGGVMEDIDLYLLKFTEAPWNVYGKRLRDLIREPGFHLKGVTTIDRSGRELIRFDFALEPSNVRETAMRGGWLLLAPDDHWAIQAYEITASWGKTTGTIEYRGEEEGFPRLHRVTEVDRAKSGDAGIETSCEFQEWVHRIVPEREFTLTSFGLPEVVADDPHSALPNRRSYSSHTEYWFLGLGLLCAAIAVTLRVLSRRSRGSGTGP